VPKLPAGRKRQLPDAPTPEMLKRMRMDPPASPGPSTAPSSSVQNGDNPERAKPKSSSVTVEEAVDEDAEDSADFAPGGDADYFAEEDDEGRFFGGGLTDEQKKIFNIFDGSGNEGAQDDVRVSQSPVRLRLTLSTIVSSSTSSRSLVFEGCSYGLIAL
jgi:beta-catenin-like protein 1